MSITPERKAEVIKDNQRSKTDTGSAEVQIAILTERIVNLTEHMKSNKFDLSSRRGLLKMVSNRRSLLSYLKKTNEKSYTDIIKKLGIRG